MTTIIRASSLPSYSDCPRRWAARTIVKELNSASYEVRTSQPISIGASIGSGFHGGAAFMLLEKMSTGELGNADDADAFAINEFEERAKEGVLYDNATANIGEGQQQIKRMLKVYRATVLPEMNPIAVERRLEANIGDDFQLSGQSDLQTLTPGEIGDHKTGTFHRTHYAQIGSYSLLARTAHPEFPVKSLRVNFVPRVSLKKEQPLPVVEYYDQVTAENAAQATIDHIKISVREYRRRVNVGDAPPEHAFLANPNSMLCNPKWCPAHGTDFCREHRGAKE